MGSMELNASGICLDKKLIKSCLHLPFLRESGKVSSLWLCGVLFGVLWYFLSERHYVCSKLSALRHCGAPLTVFLAVGSLSPYTGVATGRFLPPALQGGASSCASETQRSLWQGQVHALKACSLVLLMRTELACCRIQVRRSCATGELGEGLVTVLCCWVSGSASVLDVFQPIPFTSFPDMFFLLAT